MVKTIYIVKTIHGEATIEILLTSTGIAKI